LFYEIVLDFDRLSPPLLLSSELRPFFCVIFGFAAAVPPGCCFQEFPLLVFWHLGILRGFPLRCSPPISPKPFRIFFLASLMSSRLRGDVSAGGTLYRDRVVLFFLRPILATTPMVPPLFQNRCPDALRSRLVLSFFPRSMFALSLVLVRDPSGSSARIHLFCVGGARGRRQSSCAF